MARDQSNAFNTYQNNQIYNTYLAVATLLQATIPLINSKDTKVNGELIIFTYVAK